MAIQTSRLSLVESLAKRVFELEVSRCDNDMSGYGQKDHDGNSVWECDDEQRSVKIDDVLICSGTHTKGSLQVAAFIVLQPFYWTEFRSSSCADPTLDADFGSIHGYDHLDYKLLGTFDGPAKAIGCAAGFLISREVDKLNSSGQSQIVRLS